LVLFKDFLIDVIYFIAVWTFSWSSTYHMMGDSHEDWSKWLLRVNQKVEIHSRDCWGETQINSKILYSDPSHVFVQTLLVKFSKYTLPNLNLKLGNLNWKAHLSSSNNPGVSSNYICNLLRIQCLAYPSHLKKRVWWNWNNELQISTSGGLWLSPKDEQRTHLNED